MFNVMVKKTGKIIKGYELDKLGLFIDCNGRVWESQIKPAYRGVTITLTGVTNRYGILRKVGCG